MPTKLIFLSIVLFFASCKQEKADVPVHKVSFEEGISISIQTSAGTYHEIQDSTFMPCPFNVGIAKNYDNTEFILVSESVDRNDKVKVIPIGFLSVDLDSVQQNYILSVHKQKTQSKLPVMSFADFSVQYSDMKNIIESWIVNLFPNKSTGDIRWSSEQTAFDFLEKKKLSSNKDN